jgi:hypothetical protein
VQFGAETDLTADIGCGHKRIAANYRLVVTLRVIERTRSRGSALRAERSERRWPR